MASQVYTFFNNTSTLSITLSSEDSTLAQQVFTYTSSSPIYWQWVGGDNEVDWSALANASSGGSTVIGWYANPSGSVEYCFLDTLIYGSSGSAVFSRKYNDPEAGTVTYYFNVYDASSNTWQTEYNITTNSNYAKTTGWWGNSTTNADVARKVVTCSGFTLTQGAIIGISFGAGNTTDTPTLNVNNTGAKSINMTNGAPSATNPLKWSAPSVLYFMYDGSAFRYLTSTNMGAGRPNQGAGSWYGISTTAATTAAKVSTIANFVPCKGALVSITFTYANTVNGLLTLNVNGTGAKNIYYNGSVTSSSNPLTWTEGEQITFILNSLTSDGGVGYRFVSRSKSSSPATVTLTQLQTGTDTTGYLISPKVLADYIASLDATNVAY